MTQIALGSSKEDWLVAALKSAAGMVPYAGNALSELIGGIIPNQRMDRLEKYVTLLAENLSRISEESISRAISNSEGIDLIEEGFAQASRAITYERRKYIAEIVRYGLDAGSTEYNESKFIMKMLGELNDSEIIWLKYFEDPVISRNKEFYEANKNILHPVVAHMGSDTKTFEKAEIQKSYKEHLERLGLISSKIRIDNKTKLPEFDPQTGHPKTSYTTVTRLGRMVLKQIGLSDHLATPS